jgi:hypothetical protein
MDMEKQCRQFRRIWHNLILVLPRISQPTRTEIAADEYDGSVAISEWLARRSHDVDIDHNGRSLQILPAWSTGCFSSSLASRDAG